ncbi:MAG: HTH domain-containing protein [Halobacteria archaeon]|nr:HTH domain-containing protein [Halobacteria archaeon]
MAEIDLSSSQKQILTALIDLFKQKDDVVKEIAERIDRNPGTIRNQMQSLKALQLVEGIPGPKGGYKPTADAYESLDIELMDEPAAVPLLKNGEPVSDANVAEIDLTSVHHPSLCRAEIHVQGSVHEFHEGDKVKVGPTPISSLVIECTLDGKDDTNNILICKIDNMEAPSSV